MSTGIDMIKSVMDLALGLEPDLEPKLDKGSALRHIVGIEGVIEKTDIHRTDFVYDFDEETGKGIGLSKTEREGNIL